MVHYTIMVIKNPQNSIGNYLGRFFYPDVGFRSNSRFAGLGHIEVLRYRSNTGLGIAALTNS